MRTAFIFFLPFLFLAFNNTVFSQDEEEKTQQELFAPLQKPSEFKGSAGFFVGYDTNSDLTAERNGSGFEETTLDLHYKHRLTPDINLLLSYYADYIFYNNRIKNTSIDNYFKGVVTKHLAQNLSLGVGFSLDINTYPYYNQNDYFIYQPLIYLKHKINDRLTQQFDYSYYYRDFKKAKMLADNGSYTAKSEYEKRNIYGYSLDWSATEKTDLTVGFQFYKNDRNDKFMDYYDYTSYKEYINLMQDLAHNFYLVLSFTHQFKNYDARTIFGGDYRQKDNLYIANLGIIYALNNKTSLDLYYTYRDNSSNDSTEEYTESIISCGMHYYF